MQKSLRMLGKLGLALLLVSLLIVGVVPPAPVSAATSLVANSVWVEFPSIDAAAAGGTGNLAAAVGLYRIHLKTTTALVRQVDTIIIQFPDGVDTALGPSGNAFTLGSATGTAANYSIDGDAWGTGLAYYPAFDAAAGSKRVTLTVDVDIPAGADVWVMIDDAANMVTGGSASTSAYKVRAYTSKDTTPVLSKGFYLGASGDAITTMTSVIASPTTAGATSVEYTFTFTVATALTVAAGDSITVTFPYGTTLPSSMAPSTVTTYNAGGGTVGWSTVTEAPTIDTDLRTVKVVIPADIGTTAGAQVKFSTNAGMQNPTKISAAWGAADTSNSSAPKVGFIRTSQDMLNKVLTGYTITYDSATKLAFTSSFDAATMINMYSSADTLQVQDQYSNLVSGGSYGTATVTLTKSSSTGGIYYDGGTSYTLISSTKDLASGAMVLYYMDTTAGTYTITATLSPLTPVTKTIVVAPAVTQYDSYGNLLNSFAAPSATPVEETDQTTLAERTSGYYVQQAIDASTSGDQVRLGDGTYETTSTTLTLSKEGITVKSVNGVTYTTIAATTAANILDFTAASVTLDGVTVQGDNGTTASQRGAYIRYGGFTVKNSKFSKIANDNIFVESAAGAITSGTIDSNTITGLGRASARNGILVESYSSNAISGINITNNTVTNVDGPASDPPEYAIKVAVGSGAVSSIKVSGNTLTDNVAGIGLYGAVTGMTGSKAVASNTISGSTMYGIRGSYTGSAATFDLVKNTVTNNLVGIHIGSVASSVIKVKYNDITSNTGWGMQALASVDAKYNWWGDASGPSAGTTSSSGTASGTANSAAKGSGQAVTTLVTFSPWMYKTVNGTTPAVVADNVSYQAVAVSLVAGWNTLSTPVKLISTADAIDELITSGLTIGYYYNSSGWQQITTGYVLSPGDAVYLKMSAAKTIVLYFDAGAFSTPSRALTAGWNLIGLAGLSSMTADNAVASVKLTATGTPGYSQVVSPSINTGLTDIYGIPGTAWTWSNGQSGTAGTMYSGLGYWIYMQNAATLAGFEITPIVPNFN